MNKAAALMSGVGIGSGLMYLLDPNRGRRRRAMIREKFARAAELSGSALGVVGKTSRDLASGARGVVSMGSRLIHSRAETTRGPGWMGRNWPPALRILAGAAGGALAAYGFSRRSGLGATAGFLGAALAARGITNRDARKLFGLVKARAAA